MSDRLEALKAECGCPRRTMHLTTCPVLPDAPATEVGVSLRRAMHAIEQIVVVMCERGMRDDIRLSEIQDHLTIAGYDVPLRGYAMDPMTDRLEAAARVLATQIRLEGGHGVRVHELADAVLAALAPAVRESAPGVTRLEVIDHRQNAKQVGRSLVVWDDTMQVELSYQDQGRTLKIFLDSKPAGQPEEG